MRSLEIANMLQTCLRKKAYRTEAFAERLANELSTANHTLYVYKCELCEQYHLTHKSWKDGRAGLLHHTANVE